MTVLESFHSKDQWCKSLSATFITLIPKKKGPSKIKDCHPIILVVYLYKLLFKILALHLKAILLQIISKSQNAFVLGRWIMDCLLLANECINAWLKAGKARVGRKIDTEKAFDQVCWPYLDNVLQKRGSKLRWRNWMKICISSPSF